MSRPPILRLHDDDLVIDSFAGGGGASLGIEMALERSPDIAINHDPEALAMHAANHPSTRHLCESVWDVSPREVCRGRRPALAWFSPDCTFHSKARGGKPFRDRNPARRRRGLAWIVVKWAKEVQPRVICLENVEEFADWGPLDEDGKPDPARRGLTFRRWWKQLENAGYVVEMRELRACDYGAPTSRKRLFVIARCDGEPIVWPEPTHGPGRLPYRTAAECIDWTLPCPSIFERERPLAENTLRRIARGIRRYVLEASKPFIVPVKTWGGGGNEPRSIEQPLRTVTTSKRGEHALVAPTLVQTGYGEREGQAPRALDIEKPLGTIISGGTGGNGKHALVSAFLARHYGGHENDGAQLGLPMHTITTQDHHALVASHLRRRGDCEDPLPSWDDEPKSPPARDRRAEVRAFLIKYYGSEQDPRLELPLGTVTTKDRFGLVTVEGVDYQIADIGMRMLAPRELFRAQGFPDSYVIDPVVDGARLTKTAQVRMCGNSVCPPLAAAIVRAQFAAREEVQRVA